MNRVRRSVDTLILQITSVQMCRDRLARCVRGRRPPARPGAVARGAAGSADSGGSI